MKRIGRHLTFANIVACVALFVALGGASYAAFKLPKNSVGAGQLKKGAVTPVKIAAATKAKLTGAPGPAGPTGPAGAPGSRGPSNAYYAFNNDVVNRSKEIALSVPAGNYVATGSMLAVNRESKNDRLGCDLESTADTTHSGGTALNVPKAPEGTINTYVHPAAETVFAIGGTGGTIVFQCENVEGTATLEFYFARLTAIAVGALSG